MVKILFWLMVLSSLAGSIAVAADPSVTTPKIAKFFTIADIHFDPFLGCKSLPKPCVIAKKLQTADPHQWRNVFEQYQRVKMNPYYHDTGYPVLRSMLAQLNVANKKEKPEFIMILGDFLAHDFRGAYIESTKDRSKEGYERFVKKTMQFLTIELNAVFPQTDVYPVVGNNDSYTDDYSSVPKGRFFKETAETWSELMKNSMNKQRFLQTFPYAGYYSVFFPSNNRLFVLNTVLFSANSNNNAAQKQAAQQQLSWLHKELSSMQHHYALFAYHIPMGLDIGKSDFTKMQKFWFEDDATAFKKELKSFSTVIQGMFYGHLHLASLQILTFKIIENVKAYLTPSVSPILGNQPSFSIYYYQVDDLKIVDSEVRDIAV